MNEALKAWIEENLLTQDSFTPERCGMKRILYSNRHLAPLASLFLDPPPKVLPSWEAVPGKTWTESLFVKLRPLVTKVECWWFFVSFPENEYTCLRWVAPFDERHWNASRLYTFENIGSEGGAQFLGLLMGEERELLVFELSGGMEIAFYGSDKLWGEIHSLLGR